MKKIFCLMLVVTVLLSVLIFPASASFLNVSGSSSDVSAEPSGISTSFSDEYDYVTDETNEPVVIYNPQTGEEETFVLPVDSSDPTRSSEPMISEPYTPDEKVFVRSESSGDQSRNIVGSDNRIKVNDTSVSPFCKIVFIRSTYSDGNKVRATGVILGPDLVLTCAHAIYREQFGGWPVDVRVYTEVNGVRPPYDSYAGKSTTQMVVPAAWVESDSEVPGKDWAYVIVDTPIGYQQGWMGFGTVPTSNNNFNLSGYPDHAPGGDTPNNYFMYTQSGSIIGNDESGTMIRHTFDTGTGQSGSPLYTNGEIVYGIHVLGGPPNLATKISTSLYNYLLNQRNLGIERWSEE